MRERTVTRCHYIHLVPQCRQCGGNITNDIAGDWEGDGDIDLAVAGRGDDTVWILVNDGTGQFTPAQTVPLPAGAAPASIVAGDFTGDGLLDLAVANQGTDDVSLIVNNTGGTLPDCNRNGVSDSLEIVLGTSPDTDADGVIDECDGCPNDATKIVPGICGCGVADTDNDGDGTPDCFDQCPDDPDKLDPGACGCGTPDTDSDGDGVLDCLDNCPNDPNKLDPGICGCDTPDTDSDNDSIPDCLDNCPTTANADQTDRDGNGVGDVCEPPPVEQTTTGGCGCGNGMDGIMVTPMTLLGIGWMRRRRFRVCR